MTGQTMLRWSAVATVILIGFALPRQVSAQDRFEQQRTYCNPLNLDYGYSPIPGAIENGKHRATADPAMVVFRGDCYLFSTNQWGYWWSRDMSQWTFVPRKFLKPQHDTYDELCAPALWVMDDALYVIGSTYTKDFPVWKSSNPRVDDWVEATPAFEVGAWDPAFFVDDDGRLYLYHGSSNDGPIYGWEIDRETWKPKSERHELIRLDDAQHGWERFGEANDNTWLRPFIEGAWMTKHDGKYYLQYGAPGTEFSGYADGVYVSNKPLGPFRYQDHNPVSYKPGGFARGAGHGSTFCDPHGQWWHVSTIAISVKNNFERRIGIWPAGFGEDGVMFCNTAYGDYPQYLPQAADSEQRGGDFAGWMLLNYAKPVTVSSALPAFPANYAVDEDIKTYWCAATGDAGEWIVSDLGGPSSIHAIQLNYADQDATIVGKQPGLIHRYVLKTSLDGQEWSTLIDKGGNLWDVPHDYIELGQPVEARFVKLENIQVPSGKFALSGLRVFGRGYGTSPEAVEKFMVLRAQPAEGGWGRASASPQSVRSGGSAEPRPQPPVEPADRRNAWLRWQSSPHATGYVIYAGIDPEKLYTSVMVYGANEYYFRAMDRDRPYYFQIEAFNEVGISPRSEIVEAK